MHTLEDFLKHRIPDQIVLDVGGVLLDYRLTDMIRDLGLPEDRAQILCRKLVFDPLWHELDLDLVPYGVIAEQYAEKYAEDADVIRKFFRHPEKMQVARPRTWALVRRLKEAGYGLYLLSNYCKVQFDAHTRGASFLDDIDGKLVSYEVHAVKPDDGIYQAFFRKFDLRPETCLFFDDRPENVEGSIRNGMPSVRVSGEEQLIRDLSRLAEIKEKKK